MSYLLIYYYIYNNLNYLLLYKQIIIIDGIFVIINLVARLFTLFCSHSVCICLALHLANGWWVWRYINASVYNTLTLIQGIQSRSSQALILALDSELWSVNLKGSTTIWNIVWDYNIFRGLPRSIYTEFIVVYGEINEDYDFACTRLQGVADPSVNLYNMSCCNIFGSYHENPRAHSIQGWDIINQICYHNLCHQNINCFVSPLSWAIKGAWLVHILAHFLDVCIVVQFLSIMHKICTTGSVFDQTTQYRMYASEGNR
jgi:hypothetical protein